VKEPVWLERDVVLATQEILLARFGGLAGVRDPGLLDSALGRPRQLFAYGQPSLFDLAAAYAHGIVKNHPFLDGNKRAGFLAAYMFLGANGLELEASEESAVALTVGLAAGEVGEDGYAAWLKDNSRRPRKAAATAKGKTAKAKSQKGKP
jgi:death on curing protein